MKKEAVLCLCLCTALILVSLARASSVVSTPSAEIKSVAAQFLAQVAGFNTSQYQEVLSTSTEPSVISPTHVETCVSATVSSEYGGADAELSFIDGNFWFYHSSSLWGNLGAGEQSFNDSLRTIATVVDGYESLFNASYCSDFAELLSTALQTQQLSVENGNFSLQVQQLQNGSLWATYYSKIDDQYTTAFRSVQIIVSARGAVTDVSDSMMIYHVATTDITVSEEQAITLAEPYIKAFAQNQQSVTAIKATFEYSPDLLNQRGDGDSYTLYPAWLVQATYDKPGEYNATSYNVFIWADNGKIASNGPVAFFGPASGTNAQANLPLLLTPAAVIVFVLTFAVYLHRKPKVRRK